MRRRSYILIEVLISLMLFTTLLAVLFGIFAHFSKVNMSLSKTAKRYEKRVSTHVLLQKIFSDSQFYNNTRPYFYIEETGSLVFTYNNHTHLSSELSHTVLAKLHIEDSNLCLTLWDHPKIKSKKMPQQILHTVLLHNAESLKIECFKAPNGQEELQNDGQAIPTGIWTSHWPEKYETQPSLMRLTCDGDRLYFLFPKQLDAVIYKRV